MIKDSLSHILKDVSLICCKLGRNPKDITLIGVTKFASVEKINDAVSCGLMHVGENKVQEALKKFPDLTNSQKITKHLIGHLQTNKVKDALKIFDLIQSVDSLKLIQEIEKRACGLNRVMDILVQVNTSKEPQKFGVDPSQARELVAHVKDLAHVRVLGLMTMAPLTTEEIVIRQCFRDLKELYDQFKKEFVGYKNIEMKYLSMGMTDDYKIALEEGSNMIRLGRAIFS